jgi:hypothetical protein
MTKWAIVPAILAAQSAEVGSGVMGGNAWIFVLVGLLLIPVAFLVLWQRKPQDSAVPATVQKSQGRDHDDGALIQSIREAASSGDRERIEQVLASTNMSAGRRRVVTFSAYDQLARHLLADDDLSDEDSDVLRQAGVALGIDASDAERLLSEAAVDVWVGGITSAIEDKRVTAEEIDMINARASRLRLSMDLSQVMNDKIALFIEYARWEGGDLPNIEAPVQLKPREVCHHVEWTKWLERRVVKERVANVGPVFSIPIVKGLRYRVNLSQPVHVNRNVMHEVDAGQLILTSQRVMFVGSRASKTFAWSSVVSLNPFSDAVEFVRSSGSHPIFPTDDPETLGVKAAAILARA